MPTRLRGFGAIHAYWLLMRDFRALLPKSEGHVAHALAVDDRLDRFQVRVDKIACRSCSSSLEGEGAADRLIEAAKRPTNGNDQLMHIDGMLADASRRERTTLFRRP